ncbi:MAG: hypothetical protein ACLPH3_09070, partial [Terracidiphilus sp.]
MRFLHLEDERTCAVGRIEPNAILLLSALIATCMLLPLSTRGQSSVESGTIQGTVSVVDSGETSFLPGAK